MKWLKHILAAILLSGFCAFGHSGERRAALRAMFKKLRLSIGDRIIKRELLMRPWTLRAISRIRDINGKRAKFRIIQAELVIFLVASC
jgi:hypothetical protein